VALAVLGTSIGARTLAWQAAILALFPALIAFAMAVFAGAVLVPALLPWLPGRALTIKGAIAGALVAVVGLFALPGMLGQLSPWGWAGVLLPVAAVASYVGVNFTGSTPYTSPSGVEAELRRALPVEGVALAVGLICWTIAWATRIGPRW